MITKTHSHFADVCGLDGPNRSTHIKCRGSFALLRAFLGDGFRVILHFMHVSHCSSCAFQSDFLTFIPIQLYNKISFFNENHDKINTMSGRECPRHNCEIDRNGVSRCFKNQNFQFQNRF